MRRELAIAVLGAACIAAAPAPKAPAGPNLGQTPSAADIAAADISPTPEGGALPAGSGVPAQGAAIYAAKCQVCHGANGAGGPNDRLTGGVGSLATPRPVKTVASFWPRATTVFDYIRRAMPIDAPQSLTNSEAYALTAYILSVDGIIGPDTVLDARSLPRVAMPNAKGAVSWEPNLRRPRR